MSIIRFALLSPDRDFYTSTDAEAGEKAAKEEAVVENTTPDYAAGLVSTQVTRYPTPPRVPPL